DPNAPKGPPKQDLYELDPTKHVIPNAPATGFLAGKAFTPDRIELEGNTLGFWRGKEVFADGIAITLNNKKHAADGVTLIVKPTQKWPDHILLPTVSAAMRKDPKDNFPETNYVHEGYGLTLELSKLEKGKAAGKIFLALPGAERTYLAGTFTV